MVTLNTPVSFERSLKNTDWSVVQICLTSSDRLDREGTVTILKRPGGQRQVLTWTAKYAGEGRWKISGSGTIMGSPRIPASDDYPFSLDPLINRGLRMILADWLNENKTAPATSPVATTVTTTVTPTPPIVARDASGSTKTNGASTTVTGPMDRKSNGASAPADGRSKTVVITVLVSEIAADPNQPRQEFSDESTASMGRSLKQEKQKQVITVTPLEGVLGKRWLLVDGERRYRGALKEGIAELEAQVITFVNPADRFWFSFTTNWGHEPHTPMESSRALQEAINGGRTVAHIKKAINRSDCWIYEHLQLQKLAPALQAAMRLCVSSAERLRLGMAKIICRIPDHGEQLRIWEIARREKSPGMIKLKLEELAVPLLEGLPKKGRKRKPSDNANRALSILRSSETNVGTLERLDADSLHALAVSKASGNQPDDLIKRINAVAESWAQFARKVGEQRAAALA